MGRLTREKSQANYQRDIRKHLRNSWYGKGVGGLETSMRDSIKTIGELAEEFLDKNFPKAQKNIIDLGSEWKNIVGSDMASILNFADLENGVLYLEIKHPAFLQDELSLSNDIIIEQVNEVMGREMCKSIQYVPYGRRR